MTIIAYFDETRFASNAISQLRENPKATDVSFLSVYDIDDQIEQGIEPISQQEISVPPYYTDSFYASLLPKDRMVANFTFNQLGNVLVGGSLLDQFQIMFPDNDSSTTSISDLFNNLNLSEYTDKLISSLSEGKILVFITCNPKDATELHRLLQNHQFIDSNVLQTDLTDTRS